MQQSLAVKYRPKTWEDVVGQKTIVSILKRQLATNSLKNCLLFCGASGCGKTTLARILANDMNKGVGKPIEIDAASNNGVDNVREIVSQAKERSIDGEYKFFIIDECHSISNQGWQAFLKCIEEPPKYTVFIFCTTDPQKIPETILNRVQRFNFTRISTPEIKSRLEYVCRSEGYENYEEATDYISKLSDGSLRMSLSMLDKCLSYSDDLSIENVLRTLGNCSYDMFFELVNAVIDDDEATVCRIVEDYYNSGSDIKQFVSQLIAFCLDMEKYCLFSSMDSLVVPRHYEEDVVRSTDFDGADKYYMYVVDRLVELKGNIKFDTTPQVTVEVALLQLARGK